MYENENTRSTFFRDLIVKILLILLFIFLLMWLFPMPNLSPFYDKIFSANVKTMTEAAKSYFTVERLPENEDESKRLSLQDMLDNKMILEFTDSDGKKCDTERSYVEVTKKGNEYIYKTNLACSDEEDYVIEYFGCYDICEGNNCSKNVTEYQYFKNVSQNYVDSYTCVDGYTLSGSNCVSKSSKEVSKDATLVCESGYTYNSNTGKCEKEQVEEKSAVVTCPNGYTYNSNTNKCVKNETKTNANVTYTCPTGYTLSGTNCIKSNTETISATVTYNCPSGYTQNGNTCSKQVAHTTYSCSSGTLSGSNCIISNNSTISATKSYSCSKGTLSGSNCVITTACTNQCSQSCSNECGDWTCTLISSKTALSDISTATMTRKFSHQLGTTRYYNQCTRNCGNVCSNNCSCVGGGTSTVAANVSYTCPSGYTLSGSSCVKSSTSTVAATANTTYTTEYATIQTSYTCPSGYTQSGSSCVKSNTSTIAATANYSCVTGTLSGNVCIIGGEANATYSCSIGTLSGTKCVIKTTDTKNATYSCDDGYTLKDNKCYKTEVIEDVISATAIYKSKTVKTYMWSTEEAVSGWTRTGETRVKTVSA